jgi:hypothetical protein
MIELADAAKARAESDFAHRQVATSISVWRKCARRTRAISAGETPR